MAVITYGLLVQKTSPLNAEWDNRYWIRAESIDAALTLGLGIAEVEAELHGQLVQVNRVHVWQPNQSPKVFRTQAVAFNGEVTAPNPVASWITAELFLNVAGASYPNYKRYRVQVDASQLSGQQWTSGFLTVFDDFVVSMGEFSSVLCAADGSAIDSMTPNPKYQPLQEGKAWYNRAP